MASDGAIAGFEFCIDNEILRRLRLRADHQGRAAYVSAVLTSARLMTQTGRIGFARVPSDWLVDVKDVECATGAWVGIEQAARSDESTGQLQTLAQLVPQLRATGAKVGWDVTFGWELTPDFLLMHQRNDPMPAMLEAIKTWPLALQALPTLMTDVAKIEDLELALSSGISYACGALAPKEFTVNPSEVRTIPPEIHRVGQLLNQLVIGTETSVIVSDIKSDVGLSYRLLRRMNSASFAQLSEQASIDQAVLMLGRNELYRWLSLLLVQFSGKRKVSSALQEVTLWRSRLMELLAIENHEPSPSQMFTLGLASMLGTLLKISLDEVVNTLNLPAPARQALLEQTGPWNDYLQMALQVEANNLGDNDALAAPFGGIERVMALSDEAWAWAWAAEHANRNAA
jgi:EAL and modified HD-GYP domain-containing signal transduction protein